jgi:hypothetical protein
VSKTMPEAYFYFGEWLGAQHLAPPRSPAEEQSQDQLVRFMRIAWEAGFQAGFEAKEQYDGSPLPHRVKQGS